jgi:RNA-binding protein 25
VVVPAHLQDLKEGDLPEEQRVQVLDQIAVFRENAARREREKKAMEEEKERFKAQQAAQGPPGRSGAGVRQAGSESEYGYGNRVFAKPNQNQRDGKAFMPSPNTQQQQNGSGPSRQHGDRDPQGYGDPVAFVKAQAPESKEQSDRTDEEEEMLRQQRIQRDKGLALREVSCVKFFMRGGGLWLIVA